MEKININIWDDYYEDDDVPEGKIQGTYAYIESSPLQGDDEEKVCLECLQNYIAEQKLLPSSVQMEIAFYDARVKYSPKLAEIMPISALTRWELLFKGLTHLMREQLVENLQKCPTFQGIPVNIYSERSKIC